MKIRIVSNGTPKGTQIYTEDGKRIEDRITWFRIIVEEDVTKPVTAIIEFKNVQLDIVAEVEDKQNE